MSRRIYDVAEIASLPLGISFFQPHFEHYAKMTLETGGEAYIDHDGLFIYDNVEKAGSIFTRSRKTFDSFFSIKPDGFIFSELATEYRNDPYDIYTIELQNIKEHRFRHNVSISDHVQDFIIQTYPSINRQWVTAALKNGERCFTVSIAGQIIAGAWASVSNRIGRLHSIFVKHRFRNQGIGKDLLFARLAWLKNMDATMVYSEIARRNINSIAIAENADMKPRLSMFEYLPAIQQQQQCFSIAQYNNR